MQASGLFEPICCARYAWMVCCFVPAIYLLVLLACVPEILFYSLISAGLHGCRRPLPTPNLITTHTSKRHSSCFCLRRTWVDIHPMGVLCSSDSLEGMRGLDYAKGYSLYCMSASTTPFSVDLQPHIFGTCPVA